MGGLKQARNLGQKDVQPNLCKRIFKVILIIIIENIFYTYLCRLLPNLCHKVQDQGRL